MQLMQLRKESLKKIQACTGFESFYDTGVTEIKGSNPVQAWIFFRLSFCNCISCVYNCDDLPSNNIDIVGKISTEEVEIYTQGYLFIKA